jgi:uncharacterized membrane protein YcaP (DUF421 family)
MRIVSDIQSILKRRPLVSAVVFSVIAIYLAQIVVKELVEGHVSTSRSWFAAVVIGGLSLLAAWQATRSWRMASETRRAG